MKIYIQWAMSTPQDYVMYDLRDNPVIPSKPAPPVDVQYPALDDTPGWVYAINIQGVLFREMNHYGVAYAPSTRTLTATGWTDNPNEIGAYPSGTQWQFRFPKGDPKIAFRANTDQSQMHYFTPGAPIISMLEEAGVVWQEFSSLVLPMPAATRHGVRMPAEKSAEHVAAQTTHSWEEWIE